MLKSISFVQIAISAVVLFLSIHSKVFAQNTRISNFNTIGWYTINANVKLSPKWSVNGEFQLRRVELIKSSQQNLFRVALHYNVKPAVVLRVGYAYIDTYPYGIIPIQSAGRFFSEYRFFEAVSISAKTGIVDLTHRIMLEQRFIGRYKSSVSTSIDDHFFVNRIRYQLRMQIPLKGKSRADHTPYLTAFDEIMIGFGKNVQENVFDQNRFAILLGYRLNNTFRIEAGFINQTLQLGREVYGGNVFQYNSGVMVSTYLSF